MSIAIEHPLPPGSSPLPSQERKSATERRILYIDAFRGITMAAMIFVNELAAVQGMPWWTRHAPASVDLMTYVDMVFPFFLFAIGLSLPLSVAQRLRRDPSLPKLWLHIITRSVALITLGLILANAGKADPVGMRLNGSTWGLLGVICSMFYLGAYGDAERWKTPVRILRVAGLAGVIVLLAMFRRRTPGGQIAWIDFSYPEILGLIGLTYFAVALLYIPARRRRWLSVAWFVLLLALCALSSARRITFPNRLPLYAWPFGNGALCCIVVAGVITSNIFQGAARKIAPAKTTGLALAFAAGALVSGRALSPLGISKIRATPTWALYNVAAAVLLTVALYWICDVKRWRSWTAVIRPAGSNTLLTYLLPDLWYFAAGAAGITYLDMHWNAGGLGVIRAVAFTILMLAASGALTRANIRLQL